jgi:2'-5' RNA ligase
MLKKFVDFVAESTVIEKEGDTYSKGCVMAFLDDIIPEIKDIQSKITEDEIYEEDEDRSYGFEDEPHVTILYGIHSDKVSIDEVLKSVIGLDWKQPVRIGNLGLFENEKYDVLKLKAEAQWLNSANRKLCNTLPYSNDYPDYNAHVTVAYLKPGKGKEILERIGEINMKATPNKMVYSLPDGEKKEVTKSTSINESIESQKLAPKISKAISEIDDSMSYVDFAAAVAQVLKDDYGKHNYENFLKELKRYLN